MVVARPPRKIRAGFLLAVLVVLALTLAPRAEAFVYWANDPSVGGTIGRADLGEVPTDVNQGFIPGATNPCGVAVDGSHVYWSHGGSDGRIGRANLDGTGVDQDFIAGAGTGACGVAVDNAHVYWTNGGGDGRIGRANLDGTGVDADFIAVAPFPCGVAVDDEHIYWANIVDDGTIGRADLDGDPTSVEQDFITGARFPCGVAVDDTRIYWANTAPGATVPPAIGRAALGDPPTDVDQDFIPVPGGEPCGVAVDDTHVYWANQIASGTVGRAELEDPEPAQLDYITGADDPCGVAVEPALPPTCDDVTTSTGTGRAASLSLDCSGEGALGYEIVSGPDHGGISEFSASAGTLSYTPNAGFTGEDSFTYRASNVGGESNVATATITVIALPRCEHVPVSTREGRPTAVRLACSGPGPLTYAILSDPRHGRISGFSRSAGTLTYTPDPGFSGADSLAYRASNAGGESNTATATIAVAPAPPPPPPPPPPSNEFRFGKPKRNHERGTARLRVTVPDAGELRLAKTGEVKRASKDAASAGTVNLKLKPRGKAAKRLRRSGRAKVRAEVTFTPGGGEPRTKSKKLKLKKRRR